uniref:DUF834 domain-containing protein n=1 Tax=Oryza punctata TaxID=4537 RepID=A0A0E0JJF1_ORYPU
MAWAAAIMEKGESDRIGEGLGCSSGADWWQHKREGSARRQLGIGYGGFFSCRRWQGRWVEAARGEGQCAGGAGGGGGEVPPSPIGGVLDDGGLKAAATPTGEISAGGWMTWRRWTWQREVEGLFFFENREIEERESDWSYDLRAVGGRATEITGDREGEHVGAIERYEVESIVMVGCERDDLNR